MFFFHSLYVQFFLYVIYIKNDLVIIYINSTIGAYQPFVVIIFFMFYTKAFVKCAIVLQCYYVKDVTKRIDQCS